jgi:iron complex outermembrane receptor protein
MAQAADQGLTGAAPIIVTARLQEESLQDVPVAVTAIGGDTLDTFQIDRFEDVVTRVPSLNVQVGGSGSGGQLSLRGVGSSNISAAFDSAVAFDFDGVQISTMRLVQSGFMDVAQIEIMRGPQSLYFGKSASAGVFSIRSADPTPDWEVAGRASYEFEEETWSVQGHVSGPLADTLGIRLAAHYFNTDELLINTAPGVAHPRRGEEGFNIRGTLQWDPSPDFDANLKVNFSNMQNNGAIRTSQVFCSNGVSADPMNYPSSAALPDVPAGYDCNSFDDRFYLPDQDPIEAANIPGNNSGVPFGDTDIFFARLRMNWHVSDTLTLTSTTGYVDLDSTEMDLYSYGEPGGGMGLATNTLEQFSQELRIQSDFDGAFNFMLGAFYEDRQFVFNSAQTAVGAAIIANTFNLLNVPGFDVFVGGADPVTGFTHDWRKIHTTDTEAWSLFGSVTIDITDRLELTGGLRWTDESKSNTIEVPYVHALLGGFGFVPNGFVAGPIEFSDSNVSPEVSLRYEISDDISIYAAFKTGFKSGGIDNSALPSASLANAQATGDFSSVLFDSETALGGEIGIRSILADGALRLNATAFYYVFDDLQVQNFNAVAIQFDTLNAGELTSQGVEVEWVWDTPLDGFTLSGAVTHLDAEFTDTFVTGSGFDLNGRQASRAPGWSGNFNADLRVPIGNSLEFRWSGSAQFSGSYFTDEDTPTDYRQDSFWTFDLAASIGDPDDRWRLSLIATNVGDEIYVNTAGGRPFSSGTGPVDLVLSQNRGRQVFIEAAFRY